MSATDQAIDPGPLPTLLWLPVDRLTVDHRYQRTLESRRSQKLIDAIAARFRWSAFQAILAAKTASGAAWLVIDGQHRVEAAKRCGMSEVPAVVVTAASLAEQAAAFVEANTARISVNAFALHHARLAAGEPEALAVGRLCAAAGISIPRYPIPADKLKPGETLALDTIRQLPRRYGDGVASLALATVAQAWGGRQGAVRAPIIQGVGRLLSDAPDAERAAMAERVRGFLATRNDGEFHLRALSRKQKLGGTVVSAMVALIGEEVRRTAEAAPANDGFIRRPSREELMRGR